MQEAESIETALLQLGFNVLKQVLWPQLPGVAGVLAFGVAFGVFWGVIAEFLGKIGATVGIKGAVQKAYREYGPDCVVWLCVLGALALGSGASAQVPHMSDPSTGEWMTGLTNDGLPVAAFWSQFWAIISWLTPLLLPVIMLAVMAVVMHKVIKNFFQGST